MGRQGSWFSAIKRVFSPSSKEKSTDGQEKKTAKEKKKRRGILGGGESKSFIPLFREPSSIEKILGEVDREIYFRPPISSEPQTPTTFSSYLPTSPRIRSPRAVSPPHASSSSMPSLPRVASPVVSPPRTTYQKVTPPKAVSPRHSPPRATYQKAAPPKAASPRHSPPRASYQKAAPPKAASPRHSPPRVTYQKAAPPKAASPRHSPPRVTYQKAAPTKAASPRINQNGKEVSYRPEPTSRDLQISATKIQAAYRGYTARRSSRAVKGLVRLQAVLRGQNVKRQTMSAMKQMQLLVRVQTQIHSRRTQMLENQALHRQVYKNDREVESTLSKWTYNQLVDGNNEEWDDSVLTKDAREERLRKRVEAVIKRERAMSYAYSHQSWKPQPKSAQAALGGFPWWSNWLEDRLPPSTASGRHSPMKNLYLTPPRSTSEQKLSPWLQTSYKHYNYSHDNHEQLTPRSSKSSMPIRGKQLLQTPSRTPASNSSSLRKYPRSRFDLAMRDDDSLTSCPQFSVPNYMQPTVSAQAKVRVNSNPTDRFEGTPRSDSKRRFSFPLTPNIGPFKWNRGSSKDSSSQRGTGKPQSVQSNDDRMSMGSAVSMPTVVGRRPFNRFV